MWCLYKHDLLDLNLQPRIYFFPTWSLDHSVFPVSMGGVPATILQSDIVFATSVQTGGVSTTYMKLGGVSDLTRAIVIIGLSQWQSTFSRSVF